MIEKNETQIDLKFQLTPIDSSEQPLRFGFIEVDYGCQFI